MITIVIIIINQFSLAYVGDLIAEEVYFCCRITLLLGPPGCGKTSLLKALSGNLNKSLKVSSLYLCFFIFFIMIPCSF